MTRLAGSQRVIVLGTMGEGSDMSLSRLDDAWAWKRTVMLLIRSLFSVFWTFGRSSGRAEFTKSLTPKGRLCPALNSLIKLRKPDCPWYRMVSGIGPSDTEILNKAARSTQARSQEIEIMIRGSPQLLGDQVIVAEDSQPSFDGLQTLFIVAIELEFHAKPKVDYRVRNVNLPAVTCT